MPQQTRTHGAIECMPDDDSWGAPQVTTSWRVVHGTIRRARCMPRHESTDDFEHCIGAIAQTASKQQQRWTCQCSSSQSNDAINLLSFELSVLASLRGDSMAGQPGRAHDFSGHENIVWLHPEDIRRPFEKRLGFLFCFWTLREYVTGRIRVSASGYATLLMALLPSPAKGKDVSKLEQWASLLGCWSLLVIVAYWK